MVGMAGGGGRGRRPSRRKVGTRSVLGVFPSIQYLIFLNIGQNSTLSAMKRVGGSESGL